MQPFCDASVTNLLTTIACLHDRANYKEEVSLLSILSDGAALQGRYVEAEPLLRHGARGA